jgi:hypothetical protein
MQVIFDKKVKEAMNSDLSNTGSQRLREIFTKCVEIFRLQFRPEDGPIPVQALRVTTKKDAKTFQCCQSRYPPPHVDYLRQHLHMVVLLDLEFCGEWKGCDLSVKVRANLRDSMTCQEVL